MKRFLRAVGFVFAAFFVLSIITSVFTPSANAATIIRVVDGDTVWMEVRGERIRVRLLNIDAPELFAPNSPDGCLGSEAAAHLRRLLPVGAEVTLELDTEETDDYGRTLAGVFIDGVLVNAAMAEAGLAVPMKVGDNTEFYDAVTEAWTRAEQAGVGLLSPYIECTIPGQVASAVARIEQLPTEPGEPGLAGLEACAAAITAEVVAADALLNHLNSAEGIVFRAVGDAQFAALLATITAARTALAERSSQADGAVVAERQRLEEIRLAEEAARIAAEEAAAREAAERAANSQSQGNNPQPPAYQPPANNPEPPAYQPPVNQQPAGNPRPGNAAPCRQYAPGGQTFIYIDCITKQPL